MLPLQAYWIIGDGRCGERRQVTASTDATAREVERGRMQSDKRAEEGTVTLPKGGGKGRDR